MPLPSSKDFGTTLVLLLINIFDFQKLTFIMKGWYLLWPSDTKQASKQPSWGSIFVDENTFSFIYVHKKTISFGIYNVIASDAIKSCHKLQHATNTSFRSFQSAIPVSVLYFIFSLSNYSSASLYSDYSHWIAKSLPPLEFHSIPNKWCPFLGFRFQLSVCTTVWPPKRC